MVISEETRKMLIKHLSDELQEGIADIERKNNCYELLSRLEK